MTICTFLVGRRRRRISSPSDACDVIHVMPAAHVGEVVHTSEYTAGGLSSPCVAQTLGGEEKQPPAGLGKAIG